MSSIINRRHFIQQSSLLGVGLLSNPFILSSCSTRQQDLESTTLLTEAGEVNTVLSPNYILIDTYLPNEVLIQGIEYELSTTTDYKNSGQVHLVVYCRSLTINGTFSNPSGDIIIICEELICKNTAVIDVSGKSGDDCLASEPSTCNGDHPNGSNADNLANGVRYPIDGHNGGTCIVFASKIIGQLSIMAHGGNGAKGENGANGCNGRDGLPGRDVAYRGCIQTIPPTSGSDGIPPGVNGSGAAGGNGGRGGRIDLFCAAPLTNKTVDEGSVSFLFQDGQISCAVGGGKGGIGGSGGNFSAHGGRGGLGGMTLQTERRDPEGEKGHGGGCQGFTRPYLRLPSGADHSNEVAAVGPTGPNGQIGANGTYGISDNYWSLSGFISSPFLTLVFLKSEDHYLNGQIKEALALYTWLAGIQAGLKSGSVDVTKAITPYLESEDIVVFDYVFSAVSARVNQIRLETDYFGNSVNYVTILDSEFINERIASQYSIIKNIEANAKDLLSRDYDYQSARNSIAAHKADLDNQVSATKKELTAQFDALENLNSDIFSRDNQLADYKNRIELKQRAFEDAVNNVSEGCNLMNSLTALSKIVNLSVGVASGFGAVAAGINVVSDTMSLKNNLLSKVTAISPGLNLSKWKSVFNSGGNNSVVNNIESLRGAASSFKNNVDVFRNTFLGDQDSDRKSLVRTSLDSDDPTTINKEEFKKQIAEYIDRYPEARAYQDEVLRYIDFCSETNRKRKEYTDKFHEIFETLSRIESSQRQSDQLSSDLRRVEASKLTAKTKVSMLQSYLQTRNYLIKLVYLQSKAIDYFTLSAQSFEVPMISSGVVGITDTFVTSNQDRLIQYLENMGFGRSFATTTKPIVVTREGLEAEFLKFIEGEPSEVDTARKKHVLNFTLTPVDNFFLSSDAAGWSEIYVTSCRVRLLGLSSSQADGLVSINLKHNGASLFITSDRKRVEFCHRAVTKQLQYQISSGNYEKDMSFSKITGDYQVNNKNPYLGISPFASWTLIVDESIPMNRALVFSDVNALQLEFDFYFKPFNM